MFILFAANFHHVVVLINAIIIMFFPNLCLAVAGSGLQGSHFEKAAAPSHTHSSQNRRHFEFARVYLSATDKKSVYSCGFSQQNVFYFATFKQLVLKTGIFFGSTCFV